tara:strand:+ start:3575 stop:4291 length:717 start_codon:yes stop_codon:yes gene_type:complete
MGGVDSIQAKAVLQNLVNSGPVMESAVAQACASQNKEGIARQRNGMLYSTGGFTPVAGVIAAGSVIRLFNVPIGNADPNLGVVTGSETNLTSQSRLTNEAFTTWGLGFAVKAFGTGAGAAALLGSDINTFTTQIQQNCSVTLQLGAQDVQRLGTLDMWPSAGYFNQATNIAANLGAGNAGQHANGAEVVQDYQLEIPNDTTLNMTITADRAITLAAVGANVFSVQARFYGWSQTAIMG